MIFVIVVVLGEAPFRNNTLFFVNFHGCNPNISRLAPLIIFQLFTTNGVDLSS